MTFVKPASHWLSRTARDPPFWVFLVILPLLVFFCRKLARIGLFVLRDYLPDVVHSSTVVNYSAKIQSTGIESMVFQNFIVSPVREEFTYRFLPFVLVWWAWRAWRKEAPPFWVVVFLVLVTSVWFGYIYGGLGNVLIQGPLGVVFALVYLYMSVYGKKPFLGLFAAVLLHGAYNFTVAMYLQQQIAAS